mgnify:FL=1
MPVEGQTLIYYPNGSVAPIRARSITSLRTGHCAGEDALSCPPDHQASADSESPSAFVACLVFVQPMFQTHGTTVKVTLNGVPIGWLALFRGVAVMVWTPRFKTIGAKLVPASPGIE